jgi:quinol monooxygenase YgiN
MKLITGIWKIKTEEKNNFVNLCKWIEPFSRAELGHISYTFAENKLLENTFLFFEEWENQEAIDFHISQSYFKEFMSKSEAMLLEKPIIRIYDVANFTDL